MVKTAIEDEDDDQDLPDYEEILRIIDRAPVTFLGGILAHTVKRAIAAPVFKDTDSLLTFLAGVVFKTELEAIRSKGEAE